MHTVWVRLNAVVFFGLTVLLCLSLLAALSKLGHANRHQPIIHKLALNSMKSLKNHGGVDRALLSFDLNVSSVSCFVGSGPWCYLVSASDYMPHSRIYCSLCIYLYSHSFFHHHR